MHDRRAHALASLGQGAVGQTDQREARRSRRAVGFDANDVAVDAEHRGRMSESEHGGLRLAYRDLRQEREG